MALMSGRLKLGPIPDDRPVRLTIELPAEVHQRLREYATALAEETSQSAVEPAKLIPLMVARFMASDRGFARRRPRA
jgi:hypothetical protein